MTLFMHLFFGTLVFGGFLAAPILLVWGWARWIHRSTERDSSTILSFAGFLFATTSVLLAASSIAYSVWIGGFRHYDPRLLRIYMCGLALSLLGITLSALGTARPNMIRWHALGTSIGALMFWIVAMESE